LTAKQAAANRRPDEPKWSAAEFRLTWSRFAKLRSNLGVSRKARVIRRQRIGLQ